MQEVMGRMCPELGKSTSRTGAFVATGLVVGGWTYFILTGSISTIWPMFGIANQLLACTALAIATTILLREAKKKIHALITLGPLAFVGVTTIAAGVESVRTLFIPMMAKPATYTTGLVNVLVTLLLLACVIMVIAGSAVRWLKLARTPRIDEAAAT
jgi:carbon starvation protein